MASKSLPAETQYASASSMLFPRITPTDKLLSSSISLPPDARILCSVFAPLASHAPSKIAQDTLELARRRILIHNGSASLLESFLPHVSVSNECCLHVFAVAARDCIVDIRDSMNNLHLEGLYAREYTSFSSQDLYPCSLTCSTLSIPCSTCLDPKSPHPSSSSPACLLPRQPLRKVYSCFLEAVRGRLLDDVAQASVLLGNKSRPVKRLNGGFLLGPPPNGNEWGADWEYQACTRPLVYCHLQLHLSPHSSRILIHPILRSTHFLPLAVSLPLPSGAPITLLPHGTPAFYLSCYRGPTSALTHQFEQSLQGLGLGEWQESPPPYAQHSQPMPPFTMQEDAHNGESSNDPDKRKSKDVLPCSYILAWVSVQNKQGEDKGITIIWPSRLCLSLTTSNARATTGLDWIPELPTQLHPSPSLTAREPVKTSSANIIGIHNPLIPDPSTDSDVKLRKRSDPFIPRRPARRPHTVHSSPTSNAFRAFRTLTLAKSKDVTQFAGEVGRYVDAVAKERERERERIKREREVSGGAVGSSPKIAKATATPASESVSGTRTAVPNDMSRLTVDTHSVIPQPAVVMTAPSLGSVPSDQQHPSQAFYPSPPQTNSAPNLLPAADIRTSPVVEMSPILVSTVATGPVTSLSAPIQPAVPIPVPVDSSEPSTSTTFDPYGGSSWSAPANDFMGMEMDFGMDMSFGMNIDAITSSSGLGAASGVPGGGSTSGSTYNRIGMDIDYDDAFTDDDFSFFDRPSVAKSAPTASAHFSTVDHITASVSASGLTPAAGPAPLGMSPPIFGEMHMSGSGPPLHSIPTPYHSSPWGTSALADGFTPQFVDGVPSELLPLSPGQTVHSHSVPATPNIQLASGDGGGDEGWKAGNNSGSGQSLFDPIPFASSHRVADGKYAVGKFAFSLPSPPDEEDRTEPLKTSRSYFAGHCGADENGWRPKYNAATDPRIGVVLKLIGVKRKSGSKQGLREGVKLSPAWVKEHEEWGGSPGDGMIADGPEEDEEDSRSEDEDEDDEIPVAPRPSTPLPSYLPLGPTLLHTQFQHISLLPLSTPLRPPGAAVAPTNIVGTIAPISVPTPVSPAATMGAASEKSKSLEAAASTVATEVVENSVWAEAWRANKPGLVTSITDVWQAEIKCVCMLLNHIGYLEEPLELGSLFELRKASSNTKVTLQPLESPMVSIGKGDAVIQILPTALRFWEKLGLGPKGGRKDITAFVLFEDNEEGKQRQVESWLVKLSAVYFAKHFGLIIPGTSSSCVKDGIVPMPFDSFRKNIGPFVSKLPIPQSSLVFFIVTPSAAMTLASSVLRQVFAAVKKAQKTYSEAQILFQFVPEQLIAGCADGSPSFDSDLEQFSHSVYNRVLQPVDRLMARRFFEHGERIRNYIQDPAFTLARPIYNKVSYVRQAPSRSLDVVDRHTLLHVGYQVTPCGKWILAACVDQRGEAHDLGVWLTQSENNEAYTVSRVWEFAVQFARRANVEWRIVFARLGSMTLNELDAWTTYLATAVDICHELPMMHISLLSVEPDAPWAFIVPEAKAKRPSAPIHRVSSRNSSGTVYVDISATTYALFPSTRIPLSSSSACTRDLGTELAFVPDADEAPCCEVADILPLSTTILVRVPADTGYASTSMLHIHLLHTIKSANSSLTTPDNDTHADITHNYHDLAVLAVSRCNLGVNPLLPYHLAAVEAMNVALGRGDSIIDY